MKNFDYLNRDLSRVVAIDASSGYFSENQSNTINVPKFEGDGADDTLLKLKPFLVHLGKPQVKDIREEIKKYGDEPHLKYQQKLRERVKKLQGPSRGRSLQNIRRDY